VANGLNIFSLQYFNAFADCGYFGFPVAFDYISGTSLQFFHGGLCLVPALDFGSLVFG
jgi:hypothetical protein